MERITAKQLNKLTGRQAPYVVIQPMDRIRYLMEFSETGILIETKPISVNGEPLWDASLN